MSSHGKKYLGNEVPFCEFVGWAQSLDVMLYTFRIVYSDHPLLPGKVKVIQSCLTLCNSTDCIVHGIVRAKILEWVAFPISRDPPNPGTEPRSPALQADSLPAEPQGKPKKTRNNNY